MPKPDRLRGHLLARQSAVYIVYNGSAATSLIGISWPPDTVSGRFTTGLGAVKLPLQRGRQAFYARVISDMDALQAIAQLVRPHIHKGRFVLEDGQTTDWYVNGRAFMLTPEGSILAGRFIGKLLASDVRCIGGPATAAIPVVTAVVHQSPVPRTGFYVRAESKAYGMLNRIEGNLEPEVAIVDDTCYTGDPIIRCIAAVEEAGSVVRQVVAVFDRGDGGQRVRELGYEYRYVLRIEDGEPQLSPA